MLLLKALEFAFGAFILAFVAWQIVSPLLQGDRAFPAFRKKKPHSTKEKK